MAKRGTSVFRNPVDKEATKVATLPDLTAYQAKWGTEGRPSPRTGTTGAGITKFGTQQLKYVDPAQPALGVVEIDTGAPFRLGLQNVVKSAGIDFGKTTPFSQTYQQKRLGTITTYEQLETSPHAPTPSEPINLGDIFGIGNGNGEECDMGCFLTGRGCDCGCKDVKPCTTCDSTVCKECDAWDIQCEDCRTKDGTCTAPVSDCDVFDIGCKVGNWWEKYGIYVMIIGGLIGLGIVLWLLRPLFGVVKNVTGVIKK